MKRQNASSVLEIIIAMAIAMPCLLCLTALVRQSAEQVSQAKKLKNKTYNTLRIKHLAEEILKNLDSHPFQLLPRVHKSGIITLTNNRLNAITEHIRLLKPSIKSDAISYTHMNLTATQEIISIKQEADTIIVYSCSRYGENLFPADYKSYLLLQPQGFFEASGELIRDKQQSERICFHSILRPTESMIAQPLSIQNALTSKFIIPLRAIYTIYVDAGNRLRYLGHSGERNIENQPILNNIGEMQIDVRKHLNSFHTEIEFMINDKFFTEPVIIKRNNSIGRVPYINFLLNRP